MERLTQPLTCGHLILQVSEGKVNSFGGFQYRDTLPLFLETGGRLQSGVQSWGNGFQVSTTSTILA